MNTCAWRPAGASGAARRRPLQASAGRPSTREEGAARGTASAGRPRSRPPTSPRRSGRSGVSATPSAGEAGRADDTSATSSYQCLRQRHVERQMSTAGTDHAPPAPARARGRDQRAEVHAGGSGVPRTRFSTPRSRRITSVIASPANVVTRPPCRASRARRSRRRAGRRRPVAPDQAEEDQEQDRQEEREERARAVAPVDALLGGET